MYDDARDMYELEYPAPDMGSKSGDRPTLVVALNGYADAGMAVEAAADHLVSALDHRPVATFDSDELIDYRSRRPAVTIANNQPVEIDDTDIDMKILRDNQGKPFLLLSGPEPDLRWNGFTEAVADLVEKLDVEQTICLYAAPMTVPHTRPMTISGHGNSQQLIDRLVSWDQKLMVPGSAALYLERALHKRGRNVAGYTAHVPHYLASSPYPLATYNLLRSVASVSKLDFPLGSLEYDIQRISHQVEEQVGQADEVQSLVAGLEEQFDEGLERYREQNPQAILPGEQNMPTGDEIGASFEQFLDSLDNPDAGDSDKD
ncbi:PAC2 family protein [Corynebacterium propinquum]|uniref:PAC2 family protein n=1 Tax=Corynebacterium propinquum TaxID=43769 RepID=UPI000372C903|nr:PAC2 family protein [Corynebacterium propinquum]MDK4291372.1 PAC2 family protein [Corynebacterium propinquum]QQU90839.1 PAC2 family protein [Corynebacterium propinquum]WKS45181.1 PAC2 family protein [Corynebacterium propinquum]